MTSSANGKVIETEESMVESIMGNIEYVSAKNEGNNVKNEDYCHSVASTSLNEHFLPLKRQSKSMEGSVTFSVCITCYSVFMLVWYADIEY